MAARLHRGSFSRMGEEPALSLSKGQDEGDPSADEAHRVKAAPRTAQSANKGSAPSMQKPPSVLYAISMT